MYVDGVRFHVSRDLRPYADMLSDPSYKSVRTMQTVGLEPICTLDIFVAEQSQCSTSKTTTCGDLWYMFE